MIRTLVTDDDPFIRESLRLILGTMAGIEAVGICSSGKEAADFIRDNPDVDVVLMDIRMPDCDGVEGTRLIKALDPNVKVLILTTFDDDEYIVQAIRAGASGYMLKNVPPETIAEGIRTVHRGNMLIHPDIARKLGGMLQTPRQGADGRPKRTLTDFGLTETEAAVMNKIAEGLSNKEIAQELHLSEGTVKNYITAVLGKLSLRDRTQIAIFYLKEIDGGTGG